MVPVRDLYKHARIRSSRRSALKEPSISASTAISNFHVTAEADPSLLARD